MKTKIIKGAVDILLVDANDLSMRNIHQEIGLSWGYHCRLSEMTEDQAHFLILENRTYTDSLGNIHYLNFKMPIDGPIYFQTAKESFQSLLEENGVLKENKYHKPVWTPQSLWINRQDYEESFEAWQEAEANVFPPETTLVFIKTQ